MAMYSIVLDDLRRMSYQELRERARNSAPRPSPAGGARAAGSALVPPNDLDVGVVEGVSALAAIKRSARPSPDVRPSGDDLHMVGVDAVPNAAQVVDHEVVGDGADERLPGVAVGVGAPAADAEYAVSGSSQGSGPEPAISDDEPIEERLPAALGSQTSRHVPSVIRSEGGE